jgi:simple sugar transport system substrate-binding protein
MNKTAAMGLAALLLCASCGEQQPPDVPGPDAVSAATGRRGPTVRSLLARYMPEAMSDGMVKLAIVRNLAVGDHTRQFLEGCVSEGRSLGFTVDTFVTGGDNERCRELLGKIARADYDGLILSNGGADFTSEALRPVLERGIRTVTFDALPFERGDPAGAVLPGVTATFQEDEDLARLSLEAILSRFEGKRPVRLIRIQAGPGIPPLDRRQQVYDGFVREGMIEEAALISPPNFALARRGVSEALSAVLPRLGEGAVDAIWAPYDEFAKGAADALYAAGRMDIALMSIDLSNDDIKMMLDHQAVWLGTAAVDPRLIGVVNIRLLAAKLAGEATPDTYSFPPRLVRTADLNHTVTMANISLIVPGWGQEAGLFDEYPWMAALKAAEGKYLRLPPAVRPMGQGRK